MLFRDSFPAASVRFTTGFRQGKLSGKTVIRSIFAVALLMLSAASSAATIGAGYSGMWYDPARNGEGLQLEIMSPDTALVEWYTYNEQGGQPCRPTGSEFSSPERVIRRCLSMVTSGRSCCA